MIETIGTFVVLLGSCFFDIRQKRIPIWILEAGGILAAVCVLLSVFKIGAGALTAGILGMLPGAGILALGFLTEEKIGYGDGILLIIIGVLEGAKSVLLTFCIGLFLQSLCAVVLVLMKKADKQTQIPFVPFLLMARIGRLFV